MGLSTNKFVPPPPPSGPMEERSTKSLLYLSNQENRASNQNIDKAISPYLPPKQIVLGNGKKFLALGRPAGGGEESGFIASWDKVKSIFSISGGKWKGEPNAEWNFLEGQEQGGGGSAYLVVTTDEDCQIQSVSLSMAVDLDAIETEEGSYGVDYVKKSNILLAEMQAGEVVQHIQGNVFLSIMAIDGFAARWPEVQTPY